MKFRDYLDSLPEERRAKIQGRARDSLREMHLSTLREAASVTQQEIADRLQISQGAVSRLENRADMLLSTFSRYIEALGGGVAIKVALPGAEFQFSGLSEAMAAGASTMRVIPTRMLACRSMGVASEYVVVEGVSDRPRAVRRLSHDVVNVSEAFDATENGPTHAAALA